MFLLFDKFYHFPYSRFCTSLRFPTLYQNTGLQGYKQGELNLERQGQFLLNLSLSLACSHSLSSLSCLPSLSFFLSPNTHTHTHTHTELKYSVFVLRQSRITFIKITTKNICQPSNDKPDTRFFRTLFQYLIYTIAMESFVIQLGSQLFPFKQISL